MKVLILSTYERTGGAAIAANRLLVALRKSGVEASLLCRRNLPWWPKGMKPQSMESIWERIVVWVRRGFSIRNLWAVDIANCGQDITQTQEFRDADVIHLHWVNQGFVSLETIGRILDSGKRVVWTMHDEWALEGIYHYTYGETPKDALNREITEAKRRIYARGRISFVACSRWLKEIASRKPLGVGQEVISIPNPIDTEIFSYKGRGNFGFNSQIPVILFACQKVTDPRKGFDYLVEAVRKLDSVAIALVGANTDEVARLMPPNVRAYSIGMISDPMEMAELYSACDCFVTPSLQDNLPNTIMEAMACGTPCVGFNVGGIPEMIDHRENGYVAEYKSADDLSEGIRYVIAPENAKRLSVAAREKVMKSYSEEVVAQRYMEVYRSLPGGGETAV